MKQSEQLLRRVVRKLLTEAGVVHEENREVENGGGGDRRVQVELLSDGELSNFQFPGWFQRLLTESGTADLVAFNQLMYDSFDELGRRRYGNVVVEMIQSKDHPEFLTLYCSLMREINPMMEVNQIVNIILELMNIWLQDENHKKLWLCLTQQINQTAPKQPTPVQYGIGCKARLLPRYETDDLKQAVEMGVQTLNLNEQQAQLLQRSYLKLTAVMNELYHAKSGQVEISNTLDVLKLLLKEYLSQQQLNIKDASGSSQNLKQKQVALIPLGDGQELLGDDQISATINSYGLGDNLSAEELKIIEGFHDNIMKQLPNLQKLYNYIKIPSQDMSNDISTSYREIKESLIGFLQEKDIAADIQNSNMKAFIKYLMIIVTQVEDKYNDTVQKNSGSVDRSKGEVGESQGQISAAASFGENSIHADVKILNDFVSGINLLSQDNFSKSHVNLAILRQDRNFIALWPKTIKTLMDWNKRLNSLQGSEQNELMEKYVKLVGETYSHYEKLLGKLREGIFYDEKFDDEKGRNDTPKFLYQLLYYYENLIQKVPESEIQKFEEIDEEKVDMQQEANELLQNFDLEQFKEKFVVNNSEEINEIVKPNLDIINKIFNSDIKKYQTVINEYHPDFNQLKEAVNKFKNTMDKYDEKKEENVDQMSDAMFQIFTESLSSYLSILKKVRSGAFDYVKRYGTTVKIAIYYLLCKWELNVLKLEEYSDIEEMTEDLDFKENEGDEDSNVENINENVKDIYAQYQKLKDESWFQTEIFNFQKGFQGLKPQDIPVEINTLIQNLQNMGIVNEPSKLLRNKESFLKLCKVINDQDNNKVKKYMQFFIKRYINNCIKTGLFEK